MVRRVFVGLKGTVKRAFQHYSAIVISIIPCIIVASLVGAILNVCGQMPLAGGKPLSEAYPLVGQFCSLLQIVNECGILMIPVYITWATVRHFHGSELLGIFVGLTMVPASTMSGLEWPAAVLAGNAEYWDFALLQIPKTGFQGQILVGILGGVILVLLERKLTKAVPKGLYAFVVPLTCVLVTCFAVYLLVGPAARLIELGLVNMVNFLLDEPALRNVGGFIMGLIHLPAMMFGLHLALISVNLQQVASGAGSSLWPITVESVLAAGGAALAVLLLEKNEAKKEAAREGVLITLGLGTVEPALFGVCAKDRCAFLGAMFAAGLGGFLSRALDCNSTAHGVNGFLSFLTMPLEKWPQYAAVLGTAVGAGFLLTAFGLISRRYLANKRK